MRRSVRLMIRSSVSPRRIRRTHTSSAGLKEIRRLHTADRSTALDAGVVQARGQRWAGRVRPDLG
jgi:hypothetical protein